MSYVFIGGIPASGKSFLAKKLAEKSGAIHIDLDTLRAEMSKDPVLDQWVNFYNNQDEFQYLTKTPCEEKWANLVKQSEAFWPFILKRVREVQNAHEKAIFEAVNILPHLAQDLNFSGIYLLGESFEQILERIKKNPRWGRTEELQKLEAEIFFSCERKNYQTEAEKYEFKTFTNSDDAEQEVIKLLM